MRTQKQTVTGEGNALRTYYDGEHFSGRGKTWEEVELEWTLNHEAIEDAKTEARIEAQEQHEDELEEFRDYLRDDDTSEPFGAGE